MKGEIPMDLENRFKNSGEGEPREQPKEEKMSPLMEKIQQLLRSTHVEDRTGISCRRNGKGDS